MKLYLLKLRNLLISNFGVKIHCMIYNNNFYFFNLLFILIFQLLPFLIVKKLANLLNINLIYEYDNLYYITNKKNNILPIIQNIVIHKDNEMKEILNIKYYNSSIPLYFFLKINNLLDYKLIKLNYFKMGKKIEKELDLISNKNKLIYELFD